MNLKITTKRTRFNVLFGIIFTVSLYGCSDEKSSTPPPPSTTQAAYDHVHDDATDMEKHKFEHEFAEQCMEREARLAGDVNMDKKRFEKPCLCIATYMMKDLTAVEAEKFLEEDKDTQSLRIRFESAAYHCLQKKSKINQAPVIFKQR